MNDSALDRLLKSWFARFTNPIRERFNLPLIEDPVQKTVPDGSDDPLTVRVVGSKLVVEVGVGTLTSVPYSSSNIKITPTNKVEFAKQVAAVLSVSKFSEGSLIARAIEHAAIEASEGSPYCERLVDAPPALLPCPVCGNVPETQKDARDSGLVLYSVECCGISSGAGTTQPATHERWNAKAKSGGLEFYRRV